MHSRVAEVATVTALAVIVTMMMAAAVLRAPSERVFGMEIAGRHHDPFTLMEQFSRPIGVSAFSQPVTDIAGTLVARMWGPVAAYNWLVLITFPLSAAAAYLLARHLALSRVGATVAALAYAFSPFHMAQAAYHPHIAQTQWVPLYLLALWRCLDHASPGAVVLLGAATIAVTLSNFYGGLIAAVITPVAVAAYWCVACRERGRPTVRQLGITAGSLVIMAASAMAYASCTARAVIVTPTAFAFPRRDLFTYSAKWWSYLVPPVEHPLLGPAVRRFWTDAGVREGLLEQQVSLGAGIVALGLIAVSRWLIHDRHEPSASRARVPIIVIVAVAALVCSLSPERTIGTFTFVRPSALLYTIVPMFRAYARFGVVVQLMAALLAGIGVDRLHRIGTRSAHIVCGVLVALAACEYTVSPSALWRDVLPTSAHRWLMQQGNVRALDCAPVTEESHSVLWLTGHRVDLLGTGPIEDCTEPNLAQQLTANGYTHLLVRRHTATARRLAGRHAPDGLRVVARFDDGQVLAVTGPAPAIYTASMSGFFSREDSAQWTWRWMGASAAWTIVNTRVRPIVVTLDLELSAFHRARRLALQLDGRPVQTILVEPPRGIHHIGLFTVSPGRHQLTFHPDEGATVASDVIDNGDRRPLSCALGTWHWTVRSEQR